MSATSVADRLCVGKQLESLAKIGEALRTGEISYQSASVLCHLREQLGDKRELFVEDEMLEHARNLSVASLRYLCRYARHVADPDGFFNQAEADYTLRRLDISQMGDGMFCVDAILDPEGWAALKTALESLAKRLGPDERSHKQKDGRLLNRARAPWSRGGPTHLSNLVLLCFFHHRLVHEGGWQVAQVGHEFRFVPPDRVVFQRARAPGLRWAA